MKIIEFECAEGYKNLFEHPKPASKYIPQWYKEMNMDYDKTRLNNKSPMPRQTVKACIPVRDYLTAGYIIPLNTELVYLNGELYPALMPEALGKHSPDQVKGSSVKSKVLKFNCPWNIKTPKGYSCLFFKPHFTDTKGINIIPAIVDTDTYHSPNFPFTFDATGYKNDDVIPMNTPIVQVLPFKREDWKMENTFKEGSEIITEKNRITVFFKSGYRKFFHSKKRFI